MFCIFFDSNLLLKSFISVCLCVGVMAGFGTAAATAKVKNKIKKILYCVRIIHCYDNDNDYYGSRKKTNQTKLPKKMIFSFLFSGLVCFSFIFFHFICSFLFEISKKIRNGNFFFWGEISRKFPIGNIHLYSHTISEFLKCF